LIFDQKITKVKIFDLTTRVMYSVVFNKFICYKKNSLLIKRLFVPIKDKKKVDNENELNKTMDLNYKTTQR